MSTDERSYIEIARAIGMPTNEVRAICEQALIKLRKALAEEGITVEYLRYKTGIKDANEEALLALILERENRL